MMEVDVLSDARAHQSECSSCSSRLHDEEMLTRGLHSVAVEMNSLQASESTELSLLASFRQHSVVVPLRPTRSYRPYWLTAVAAILLIVFGLVAVVWKRSDQPKNQLAVQPVPQVPKETRDNKNLVAPDNQAADLPVPSKPKRNVNPRVLQARNSKANRAENTVANHAEVATDFMPLGYLNPALLQDGGQIVRVEVPRTTMASFGLPVNMDRYNERVKADVLLGVDGVPHAIRFVQDKRSQ
jgi:hypothetical protein